MLYSFLNKTGLFGGQHGQASNQVVSMEVGGADQAPPANIYTRSDQVNYGTTQYVTQDNETHSLYGYYG